MEVRLFLLADFANVDAGRKLNIIGAFNQFNVEQVPYEHPLFYLVIRIAATLGEFNQERTLKIKLFDEDGNVQSELPDIRFNIHAHAGVHSTEFNPVIGIQRAKFEKFGRYEYRIYINRDS